MLSSKIGFMRIRTSDHTSTEIRRTKKTSTDIHISFSFRKIAQRRFNAVIAQNMTTLQNTGQ